MSIEQLFYIVEAYKSGSFSETAKKCHLSLSAISQSISNLENELEVVIFHRSRQGVKATAQGKEIIKLAENILATLDELKDVGKSEDTNLSGHLKIAASPSLIMLLLKATNEFKKAHPNVVVEINEITATEIIESIDKGINDIGFIMINPNLLDNKKKWEYDIFIEDKMFFCISSKSPLATKKNIELKDLLEENLITYSGINTKLLVEGIFGDDKPKNLLFESNQFEVIKSTIHEGFGFSLLSGLQLQNDYRVVKGSIIPIQTKELEDVTIPFGWLRKKSSYFSPALREFLSFMKKQTNTV